MKKITIGLALIFAIISSTSAQDSYDKHPNTSDAGWVELFKTDLSNAIFPKGVWTVTDGVFTASKDEAIWSAKDYDNFILDLEFKNAEGTNSGVIVHASDIKEWIPHSVEIQIADDYSEAWSKVSPTWQCAAIFGHQAASKRTVKKAGEWNHYTITCIDKKIWVVLNGELVNVCDMNLYTSAKTNPDGTEIPAWLSNPMASLPIHGHIGFQGKHAGAPIYFRNIKIKELK
jgi:3-keto-disaccharide hydrolase